MAAETGKPKILLCEDDPNLGMVLKNYLELNDYDVILERDGRLGLAAFQREKFDLCLLDVMGRRPHSQRRQLPADGGRPALLLVGAAHQRHALTSQVGRFSPPTIL